MNNDYRKGFWTISILLLLSFVANIFIISKYSNIPKHDKRITSSLLDNLNLKQRYDIVYNSISFEWNSTIMDQDFNHQTLKSFINSGDVVFYYDSKSCYKCFLHGLTTIQEIQETGSLRNLVVISEQDNMRQFRKVMKDFRLNKIAVFWEKYSYNWQIAWQTLLLSLPRWAVNKSLFYRQFHTARINKELSWNSLNSGQDR